MSADEPGIRALLEPSTMPVRPAEAHELFFSTVRRFAYASSFVDRRLVMWTDLTDSRRFTYAGRRRLASTDLADLVWRGAGLAALVWRGAEYTNRYVDHPPPVHARLAKLYWQGEDAIERDDMEAMFKTEDKVVAELKRILDESKPADQRRHYWLQLCHDVVQDGKTGRMRRLTQREKIAAMRRMFRVSERQVFRDIANLPDK
jgi:hypothetical protein